MKNLIPRITFSLLFFVSTLTLYSQSTTFPLWQKGEFEIHQISTNCGESALLIFPDGTTMMIDAGDMRTPRYFPAVPDNTMGNAERIARYVTFVNPRGKEIDYFLLTHFHADHIGHIDEGVKRRARNEEGNFYETGINQIAKYLGIKKIIDRSYPDYSRPQIYGQGDETFANYRNFLQWQLETKNTTAEGFKVGISHQFTPLRSSEYNSDFLVENIACNGIIWDRNTNTLKDYVYANSKNLDRKVNENLLSTAMLFTYGNFSYLTGGDLCGNLLDENGELINVEACFGKAVGEVDVCKMNHHGYHDAMVTDFMKAVNARVYVMPVHDSAHLGERVTDCMVKRAGVITDKETLIIPTYFPEDFRENYQESNFIQYFPPAWGHTVIKVAPGGESYTVFIMDVEKDYPVKWQSRTFRSKNSQ